MAKTFFDGQGPKAIFAIIAALLLGLSIAVGVIVASQLWYYDYYSSGFSWSGSWTFYGSVCFMVSPNEDFNLCYWNWALTAIGIFLSVFILFFTLCNRYRNPKATTILFVISAAWWLTTAILNTVYGLQADDDTDGTDYTTWQAKKDWRTSVWALCWAGVGLSIVGAFLAIADMMNARKYNTAPPAFTQQPVPNPASYYQPQAQGYPSQGYPAAQPGYAPAGQPYPGQAYPGA